MTRWIKEIIDRNRYSNRMQEKGSTNSTNQIMNWLGTTTGKVTAGALAAVLIAAIAVPVSMKRKKK